MRILNISKVLSFQGFKSARKTFWITGSYNQETEQDFACFLLMDLEGCHHMWLLHEPFNH